MNDKLNGKRRRSRRRNLKTSSEVIEALGGTQVVADMFGVAYRVVWNWRTRGLPSDTYAVMRRKLGRRRHAPDVLWNQREVRK